MGRMAADGSIIPIQSLETKALPDEDVLALTGDYFPEDFEDPEDSEDPNPSRLKKFLAFITVFIAGFFACVDGLYLSMSALRLSCSIDTESFTKLSGDTTKFDELTNHWGNHKAILIGFLLLIPTMILLCVLGDRALNINATAQKLWFYLRAAFSAFKNTRTATISTAFIAQAFAHSTHFYTWANPIGLGLGVLCMANAIWFRRMDADRDDWIENNKKTVETINKAESLKALQILVGARATAANRHNPLQQARNYASAFTDGLTDGIYIYASLFLVLGFSTMVFPPALLIAAVATVAVITLVSVISKLNTERKRAAALELSAVNVDIAYLEKKQSLNAAEFTDAEQDELTSLQAKQKELEETVNSDNKSFLAFAGRQTIMGFKNFAAAGAILLMIPGVNVIVGLPVFIATKVLGFAYACYLAIPELIKYVNSRKKDGAEPEKEEEQAPESIQAAEPPQNEGEFDLQKNPVEAEKPSIMKSIRQSFFGSTINSVSETMASCAKSFTEAMPFSKVSTIPCATG